MTVTPQTPTRLEVNLAAETTAAVQCLMDREGVTQTEAVRRLVGYGDRLYRAIAVDGAEVQIVKGGTVEIVELI